MRKRSFVFSLLAFLLSAATALSARHILFQNEMNVIDTMDAVSFVGAKDKARVEAVPGKIGNALKFTFDNESMNAMLIGKASGKPEWDKAAGFSFWVKGDGSEHLGGMEFIWNGDYTTRYAYAFPIDSTEWKKIVVPGAT